MLVVKKHQKLILNLREPERVLALIPTAQLVEHNDKNLVVVPHRLDEVRVLRNLGFDTPHPVRYYYEFTGRFKPYEHQVQTVEFLDTNEAAFCLNDMGSGKTVSVLWAYDYARQRGAAAKMLVLGPLSTLERTWADEVFHSTPHLTCVTLHGTAEKRLKRLETNADIFVINHDGIKSKPVLERLEAMVESGEISHVVVDELASFRNAATERWKALNRLTKNAKVKWGLTGTPIPNEPTDAWAQIRLISPGRVPKYFTAFREAVMRQMGQYKWVSRDNALEHVYSVMQPAIRFSREQCIDLPPTTYMTREVQLSPEQSGAYKQMLAKFRADFSQGQVTAVNEAAKLMKLLQIVCATVYTDDGNVILPAPHRVETVEEIIDEAGAKVIVFVPLTGALENLAAALSKKYSVAVIHGGTSKAERDRIFGEFQRDKNPRVLVANPGAMSHGLTLTAANVIVWFAPINSAEIYEQANARIVRPGQKLNTLIVHIEGSALERKMYERLQRKTHTQGLLLEMFKDTETA
jgi:SNF2 family DNA or RNA helicase